MIYLHLTLLTTIIAAVALPSLGGLEASRTLNTLATPLTVVSPGVEEAMAAPDPCWLSNVECDWKFTAPVTKYIDTGIMASGKQTYVGAIACPRKYELGQRVEVNGIDYVCEDRTHKRLDGRFDIFTTDSHAQAMQYGKRDLIISVK